MNTLQKRQFNKSIPVRYILNNNVRCIWIIEKLLNILINKIWGITVLPEDSFQMIDLQMKCHEIVRYAKTLMK